MHSLSDLTRRAAQMLLAASVASVIAIAPAAADAEATASGYGTKVKCGYKVTSGRPEFWSEAELRRIKVTAPTMYALERKQTVGWRFLVKRSIDGGAWKTTYKSPIQKAIAHADRAADFSPMKVAVALPEIDPWADYELDDVHYRVVLKMFWYRPDGSRQRTVTHLLEEYRVYVDGEFEYRDDLCRGLIRQFVDGPPR
jgi:hypothetical protein